MSDIFQEIDEDLRRERLRRAWDRYGIFVLAAALLIIVITAGYRGYDAWNTSRERAAGDLFVAALDDAGDARTATAAETLTAFAEDAPSGYAMLARFRAGTVYAQADQPERAREVFSALVNDSSVASSYRDIARLRLAQIELDLGETEAARQSVAVMAENPNNSYSASAQELMGLIAYAENDMAGAARWFRTVRDGANVPPGLRARARFMLALITQSSTAAAGSPDADTGGTN